MKAFWDQQIGLDTYLPGTDHEVTPWRDNFPYNIWGKGNPQMLLSSNEVRARDAAHQKETIRRLAQPSCFEESCAFGNLSYVLLQAAQGAVDAKTRRAVYEGSDATPLMWAALDGHLAIVRYLVDEGCDVNASNALGHTALHWAITSGHLDVARFLLDHGANPWQRDKQGFDAGFVAVQNDQLPLLLMLVEDSIRAAVIGWDKIKMAYLVSKPPPINSRSGFPFYYLDPTLRDVEGHTLMHWSAYRNSTATCEYLLDYWEYNVNTADQNARTPLMWAAREGFAEVVELLLSRGAYSDTRDSDGCTALMYASQRNHPEAAYVLRTFQSPHGLQHSNPMGEAAVVTLNARQGCQPHAASWRSRTAQGGYESIRTRRAQGTLGMIFVHPYFSLQAAMGIMYAVMSYGVLFYIPPVLSHFLFGSYFFKNVIWTAMAGHPTQGSNPSNPNRSFSRKLGLAMSFRESICGTWLYRLRDPCNLFALCTLMLLQAVAWNSLGCTPLLWSIKSYTPALLPTDKAIFWEYGMYRNETALAMLDEPSSYTLGWFFGFFFDSGHTMVGTVLTGLWVMTLASMLICKHRAMRSALTPSEEGDLSTSPLWDILTNRAYQWLHPRILMVERHTWIPLRCFYCAERDVLVKAYDGYSALLDCPIGEGNHVCFVLFLTFFTLLQILMFSWGLTQTKAMVGVPVLTSQRPAWYEKSLLGFQKDDALLLHLRDNLASIQPEGTAAQVWFFFGFNTFMQLLLHGIPMPHRAHTLDLVVEYRTDPTKLKQIWFFFAYYWSPPPAAAVGVCVFHFSFIAAIFSMVVMVRQWIGLWYGATRVEIANPVAPGVDGDLVMIFPPHPLQSTPISDRADEVVLNAQRFPGKVRPMPRSGSQCIYANRHGLVNIVAFFLGRRGKAWRKAWTVSHTNTPVNDMPLSGVGK